MSVCTSCHTFSKSSTNSSGSTACAQRRVTISVTTRWNASTAPSRPSAVSMSVITQETGVSTWMCCVCRTLWKHTAPRSPHHSVWCWAFLQLTPPWTTQRDEISRTQSMTKCTLQPAWISRSRKKLRHYMELKVDRYKSDVGAHLRKTRKFTFRKSSFLDVSDAAKKTDKISHTV